MTSILNPAILAVYLFLGAAGSELAGGDELTLNKDIAQATVHSVAVGLGALLQGVKDGEERVRDIQAFIDPVRFYPDKSGYFYVYNYDCVNVAHATQKDLVGKNLYAYTDTQGKFVIRELAAAAQRGGGFVEYYWVKPGLTGEHSKIGYVEPIPNTKYFIGTGVYLPDISLGETLVRQLWVDLKNRDVAAMQKWLAEGFQSVHQDGANDREHELKLLEGLNLGDYTLRDFHVTANGPVLVVTYKISVRETIEGERLSKVPAPRLSVFVKTEHGWQWLAHANLKPLEERAK